MASILAKLQDKATSMYFGKDTGTGKLRWMREGHIFHYDVMEVLVHARSSLDLFRC